MNDHSSLDYRPIFYRSLTEPIPSTKKCDSLPSNGGSCTGLNSTGLGLATSSSANDQHLLLIAGSVQLSGVMMRKPFGQPNAKWTKRFFVIKDGFLLYYAENEKKSFERGIFNVHPKAVLPLGGCTVTALLGNGVPPYAIEITNEEFNCGFIVMGAETQREQERWTTALQQASRITWKNFQLGDAMIRELETQGLQLSKEKQDYVEKLQEEVSALRDEMDKNEELERLAEELEKEKSRLEKTITSLTEDHEKTRKEYEETSSALKLLEDEKNQLKDTTELLQDTLCELACEREETLAMLRNQEAENQTLFITTEELTNSLQDIEDEIKVLLDEKNELENRFVENQVQAQMLQEEKQIFSEQANYLLGSLNDLLTQKEMTETELKEEVKARLFAERRLRVAEESIRRLEMAVHLDSSGISEPMKLELLPDVKNLKEFFEHAAEEAQLEASKPMIMKNAIVARKSYIEKVRNLRLEKAKLDKEKSLALIYEEVTEKSSSSGLRRTKSMLLNNQTQKKLMTLRRSLSTRASVRTAKGTPEKKSNLSCLAE